jgi:hypothetical protein
VSHVNNLIEQMDDCSILDLHHIDLVNSKRRRTQTTAKEQKACRSKKNGEMDDEPFDMEECLILMDQLNEQEKSKHNSQRPSEVNPKKRKRDQMSSANVSFG